MRQALVACEHCKKCRECAPRFFAGIMGARYSSCRLIRHGAALVSAFQWRKYTSSAHSLAKADYAIYSVRKRLVSTYDFVQLSVFSQLTTVHEYRTILPRQLATMK